MKSTKETDWRWLVFSVNSLLFVNYYYIARLILGIRTQTRVLP